MSIRVWVKSLALVLGVGGAVVAAALGLLWITDNSPRWGIAMLIIVVFTVLVRLMLFEDE